MPGRRILTEFDLDCIIQMEDEVEEGVKNVGKLVLEELGVVDLPFYQQDEKCK